MLSTQWVFDPFRLDPDHACLWRQDQALVLPPKPFAVLHYLVTHPDRLVTKDELLDALWPETAVTDAVLRVAIGALRKILGDPAQSPRFIATVSRRGYRFLAPVRCVDPRDPLALPPVLPLAPLPMPQPLLVERETVWQQLHAAWAQARCRRRQLVLLSGEGGRGKTAVVEAFAAHVRRDPAVWLAYGQCVAHYGTGEAYLPVLEALGQLCRTPAGARVVALLRQQAPTWLVQLPWLLSTSDREQWRDARQGASRERMLREFADLVDALTAETPLVLILEDLHWSDYATLDLLALLARRQTPARLLVLGTYRPVDAMVQGHPLRAVARVLRQHGHSTEVPLPLLSPAAVAAYLAARFPAHAFPAALAPRLHTHTEGHPLFLVTLVQALVEQGVLVQHHGRWHLPGGLDTVEIGVPETLRQFLEDQLAHVPPEAQQVLEMASVAGVAFATATVAAGVGQDVMAVETQCEALARRQLVRAAGVIPWPDGTVVTRYEFTHALYQQAAYDRLGPGHRAQMHRRVGTCLEGAYGVRAVELAAELAVHFARGHDVHRAVHYLHQAAENALHRSAPRDAIVLLTRALTLLASLPATPERLDRELAMQLTLGPAWVAMRGYGAPEVAHAYTRARVLCAQLGNTAQLFPVLYGLWAVARLGGALSTAQTLAEELFRLAQGPQDPVCRLIAHHALATTAFLRGELALAQAHAQHGQALADPQHQHALAGRYGFHPGVICLAHNAIVCWLLGTPDQALTRVAEACTLAQALAHPPSLAFAHSIAVVVHQLRREPQAVRVHAETMVAFCTAHEVAFYRASGTLFQGIALAARGHYAAALEQMHHGLAARHATGAVAIWQPAFLTSLAEVSAQAGQRAEGLRLLTEAQTVVEVTGERWWEAEAHRLHGDLLWRDGKGEAPQAEARFLRALDVARRQEATSLELRAAMSLARLWQQQGKRAEARALLAPVYGWFTEGFDTADLQDAKALLDALGG